MFVVFCMLCFVCVLFVVVFIFDEVLVLRLCLMFRYLFVFTVRGVQCSSRVPLSSLFRSFVFAVLSSYTSF